MNKLNQSGSSFFLVCTCLILTLTQFASAKCLTLLYQQYLNLHAEAHHHVNQHACARDESLRGQSGGFMHLFRSRSWDQAAQKY